MMTMVACSDDYTISIVTMVVIGINNTNSSSKMLINNDDDYGNDDY